MADACDRNNFERKKGTKRGVLSKEFAIDMKESSFAQTFVSLLIHRFVTVKPIFAFMQMKFRSDELNGR